MGSTGKSTLEHINPAATGIAHCRVRKLLNADLVECMMGNIGCMWALPFGDSYFCKHPSAKQFADSNQTFQMNTLPESGSPI